MELELELEPVPFAVYETGESGTLKTPGEFIDSHGPDVAAESGLARSVFIMDGASSDPYDGDEEEEDEEEKEEEEEEEDDDDDDDDFPSIEEDESTSPQFC